MTLIPFRRDMFDLFGDDLGKMQGFIPPVDVYEKGNEVVVEAPLAGVDPKDVEISLDGTTLTICGKKEHKKEVDEKDYYHKEVRYGVFRRTVQLPVQVLAEKAKASSDNGVLKITLPKAPGAKKEKSLKIAINTDK